MLPVISEVATHKKYSSKNLQISRKIRSSHQKCSGKIGILKFRKFHRKTPVLDAKAYNTIEKRLQHWCFPVRFAKFLGTPILKNICERLLLMKLL